MKDGLDDSQRILRDGVIEKLGDNARGCPVKKHYSEMDSEERHARAEAIRDIYRRKILPSYSTGYDAKMLKKYEEMTDLQALKADEKLKKEASDKTWKFIKEVGKVRKLTSKMRYANLEDAA